MPDRDDYRGPRNYGSARSDYGSRAYGGRLDDRGIEEERDESHGYADRGFFDRARDEVKSWFGDEEAERRRRLDERAEEDYHRRRGWDPYGDVRDRYDRENRYDVRNRYDKDRYDRDEHRFGPQGGYYTSQPDRTDERERGLAYAAQTRANYEPGGFRLYGRGVNRYGGPSSPSAYSETGPYAGRGPRSYRRGDESIREDVNDRLSQNGYLDASEIEVSVEDGEVTLNGTVEDRRSKRLAENLADSIVGVRDVHNRLRIDFGGSSYRH